MSDAPIDMLEGESLPEYRRRVKAINLGKANAQRKRISVMREALRVGALDDLALLKGQLNDYEPIVASWPIERLLKAMRWIGPARAHEILEIERISPRKKVADLSYKQREALADHCFDARASYIDRAGNRQR